ncbi:hypothetical protein [Gordonia bronchialis]|uniref:hypothetical protein n=1 Tax=Gordonia bronchialis TaxID=2054 RepID=UPI00226FC328|nr:hypothetical protein [Gordonia bronchialis]
MTIDNTAALDEERAARAVSAVVRPLVTVLGLLLVLALALLVPGPEHGAQTWGVLALFGLGPLLVVSVWWPPTAPARQRLPHPVTATLITVGLLVSAVVLAGVAMAIVGRFEVAGLFRDGSAQSAGITTPFPFAVPLGALVFVSMLHLTFVLEKWPFDRSRPLRDGIVALVFCWIFATVVYYLVANWQSVPAAALAHLGIRNPGGPVSALELIAWLAWIAALDVVVVFLWKGWPFSVIERQMPRIWTATATILVVGSISYVILRSGVGLDSNQVSAMAAMAIVAVFVQTIVLQDRLTKPIASAGGKLLTGALITLALAALFYGALLVLAKATSDWVSIPPELWITIAGLNVLAPTLITYDAIWTRPSPKPVAAQ